MAKAAEVPNPAAEAKQEDQFTESARRDQGVLHTRDALRRQPQVQVYLPWTDENEKAFQAKEALPYPKVESVSINEVTYFIVRGEPRSVPLSVAIVLANARKIPWNMIPSEIEGYGVVREKQQAIEEAKRAEEERRRRYAGIGEGLVTTA